jgi:hypothetical protein
MPPISLLESAKTSAKICCVGTPFLVLCPSKAPPRPLVSVPMHVASRALRFARHQRKSGALRAVKRRAASFACDQNSGR